MNDKILNIIMIVFLSCWFIFALYKVFIELDLTKDIEVVEQTESGMCLQGVYPNGQFTLSEDSAGTYNYELYATARGIEVWVECNKK